MKNGFERGQSGNAIHHNTLFRARNDRYLHGDLPSWYSDLQTKAISALAYAYHKKHSRLQGYLMLATFIREQAIPPRCPPRFETSIMRRLEAAYVLRGEKVELVDGLFVRYNLLPELSYCMSLNARIVDHGGCRLMSNASLTT